ncbi:MAG: MarR family winged helix-turn-helix transcriptional regulator [Paenibacillus sp.]|uniref:MarR family winged helix-turn-helix transcriptional regulator n=1 Tax=Paenibacillus sp. TaxID=58172 RepID=UPI0029155983|nr:MarR family winged helix-turn-helix transcriptional regulator [Paenibacillus sp.]MDU4698715.1 MarR family winged helix-turn-helix transcriptional regulator [Paenibacillus sp.]
MTKDIMERYQGCYCANLRQVSRAVTQYYEDVLKPTGIKVTQYTLLQYVKSVGACTMQQVSDGLGLERTTLVRNFRILQEKGLVEIISSTSSRSNFIQLTEQGLEVLEQAIPYWNQAQRFLEEECLSVEELTSLKATLQKLQKRLS